MRTIQQIELEIGKILVMVSTGGKTSPWKTRVDSRRPSWTDSDAEIQTLLYTVFPKFHWNENQNNQFVRWFMVIFLYHRAGLPASKVAQILELTEKKVYDTVLRIERAHSGLSTAGKARAARRGRPKKISGDILQ